MAGTKNHRGWGWIRKRASGRYQASYVGPDGKRHLAPTTFETKMAAEEWIARERRDIDTAKAGLRSAQGSARLEWISPAERIAAASEIKRETIAEYGKITSNKAT